MLGSRFNTTGWWTKPTQIEAMALAPFHGHVYTLSLDNGLTAYEYRQGGPPGRISEIDPVFFEDFADYLVEHGLDQVLALEVLDDQARPEHDMLEVVIDGHGTVMMKKEDTHQVVVRRVTAWAHCRGEDGASSLKGNEGHSSPPGGQHVIFTDGRLLRDDEAVMHLLVEKGCVRGKSLREN